MQMITCKKIAKCEIDPLHFQLSRFIVHSNPSHRHISVSHSLYTHCEGAAKIGVFKG